MNVGRMAITGMLGFAVGAGLMLWPGNQKMKRAMQKRVDQIVRMSKMM